MLNNARGFAHIGALVVGFLVLCFVGYFAKQQIAIYNERKTYREAEVQITQFTNAAAKLAPSTKEIRKYCSYSSAKYSRGTLGCTIIGSVEYDSPTPNQLEKISRRAKDKTLSPWKFKYDNTPNLLKEDRGRILGVLAYGSKGLTCGLAYQYKPLDLHFEKVDTTKPQVIYSCSGPAAREYYPQ
jgi:hypothetical protein